jgi:hypothetical protein
MFVHSWFVENPTIDLEATKNLSFLMWFCHIVQEKETSKNDKKITQQVPVYFISKALANAKRYYSDMEKIFYVVVIHARKLVIILTHTECESS